MAGAVQPAMSEPPAAQRYQGIGIRFVSILIDSIILGGITGFLGGIMGLSMMELGKIPWWWGLFYFIASVAYFTYLEGSRGQTVGKMITRIKVVQEDEGKIDMSQALTRNILRVIDGQFAYLIGAVLIWRSDKKQRLGDIVAKTVVVKA